MPMGSSKLASANKDMTPGAGAFTRWPAAARLQSHLMRFNLILSPRVTRTVLALLTAIFLLISFAASGLAFFYPLEIETRESTVWLCVLALRQGINIYDHSRVAFVNMNHGPFDPIFKFAVSTLLPFLESWQVTRFAVFLLPFVFLFVTPRLIGKSAGQSRLHALCLAGMGYLFLLLSAKDVILVGRSDATVAVLFLLLVYASISFSAATKSRAAVHGLICGVIATSVMLTNWRAVPKRAPKPLSIAMSWCMRGRVRERLL